MTFRITKTLFMCALCCALLGCNEGKESDEHEQCVPQCEGLICGPDGCGGVCGVCLTNSVCTNGLCYKSDGSLDPGACQPQCKDKVCGDDGCGGLCGTCERGFSCVGGYCFNVSCTPQCGGRECGFDGCNGICGMCLATQECLDGKCVNCIPQCDGRSCGSDGCGGLCGSCAENETCNDSTAQCMPWRVSGALFYERQLVTNKEEDAYIPYFGEIEEVAAEEMPLYVYDASGKTLLGQGFVKEDGTFDIETSRLPISTDRLFAVPLWFAANTPKLAIMVADTSTPFDVWSWNMRLGDFAEVNDPGAMGDILISTKEGSGAMFLYQQIKWAYERLVATGFESSLSDLPSMAVVWKQGMGWDCGTCFIDSQKMDISSIEGKFTLDTTMEVGGYSKDESAWGLPTILHEFGHYVMYRRRDDSPGGAHTITSAEDPNLAWGEGWATFYSLMMQSLETGKPVTDYWRILGSGSYWIDYVKLKGRVKTTGIGLMTVDLPSLTSPDGMKQDISEAWVTSVLYDLWDGADSPDAEDSEDSIALGTFKIWNTLAHDRYLKVGYYNYYPDSTSSKLRTEAGTDLVDFWDALICSNSVEAQELFDWIDAYTTFPYDKTPVCTVKK